EKIGFEVIQKNSPVVYGDRVVGIIEEVFQSTSKIRFLTDPKLVISVRAERGPSQLRLMNKKALELLDAIELQEDWNWQKKEELMLLLIELSNSLKSEGHDRLL